MSRIGKLPIVIPEKVTVSCVNGLMSVVGPKGKMQKPLVSTVTLSIDGKSAVLKPNDETQQTNAMWGTMRSLLANMVTGVSEGYKRVLEFNGVGYKAAVNGTILNLSLGYSHPIEFPLPAGVVARVTKNVIELEGCDKELLGLTAAKIRAFRPPEPYKGKGVKYLEETIHRKAGKAGGKKG